MTDLVRNRFLPINFKGAARLALNQILTSGLLPHYVAPLSRSQQHQDASPNQNELDIRLFFSGFLIFLERLKDQELNVHDRKIYCQPFDT